MLSKSFINECKRLFPDNELIDKYIENEDLKALSSMLDMDLDINTMMIMSAFETSYSSDEIEKLPEPIRGLYERAKRQQEVDYLFGWLLEIAAN